MTRVSEVVVRAAVPADVHAVHDLVEPYAEQRILLPKEWVGYYEAVQEFLVAVVDEEVVGCGALVEAGDGTAEVKRMFVDPEARGLRIGKLIMDTLVARGAELGLSAIRLETGISQPEAIGLYRKAGFVEIGAFAPYRPDPLSLFMEKVL